MLRLTAAARRPRYWLEVAVFIALGMLFSNWAAKQDLWPSFRYAVYQRLTTLTWRKAIPQNTVLVVIDDEEYWRSDLGRRVPINRGYLAELLDDLDAADPAVIALDFDLASPTPDGSLVEHPDYAEETQVFLETIKDIAQRRKIVLPQTIQFDAGRRYVVASDIYRNFDFGPAAGNVYKGYIALPYEVSRVPLDLPLAGGGSVDSFALATVKAYNADVLQRLPAADSPFPLGGFIEAENFRQVAAGDVLTRDSAAMKTLAHRIAIVGARWHRYGYGTGAPVDLHFTPVGDMPGALLHANFIEAILDGRIFSAAGERTLKLLELLLASGGALLFALKVEAVWKWAIVGGVSVLLFAASYIALQNLGVFFESVLPIAFVWLHALCHRAALPE